ncbi:MAG: type II toxin-antitoxin system PemK/MazF family toxin [Anaerolineae bacterium]|nr:type II toxin-antitoxin system PemK/MazF family toxin [Caldilineales bacterium]MCX7851363.1 type II toxin-antitoxin system PemK/MazF family toxin [Caldilineales bacterium]MDW8268430.1 type II toxin-antitoxin system PemK/MazF family toxin [Anaerolineae bacterium]
MKRGEIYRVEHNGRTTLFVVLSRQALCDSAHATVICAPILETGIGLSTQVELRAETGATWGCIHLDALTSLPKSLLTDCVAVLSPRKLAEVEQALRVALDLPDS